MEDFLSRLGRGFLIGKRMDLVKKIEKEKKNLKRLDQLGIFLTKVLSSIEQKTVLMIDEEDITFHSVILVGVHKSLKGKILSDLGGNKPSTLYNSPWHIAADFNES